MSSKNNIPTTKFTLTPAAPGMALSDKEKEEKAKAIERNSPDYHNPDEIEVREIKIKPIMVRAPISYHENLMKIRQVTGMSINALCLELLWPAIKQRLKDLGID